MDVAEFDQFADEYHNLHQENIRITAEKPEYFAEYKIYDLKRVAKMNIKWWSPTIHPPNLSRTFPRQ